MAQVRTFIWCLWDHCKPIIMISINNLELSKVGIFMASAPALSVLIAIKLLNQKPSLVNWAGIAATSGALALIAVGWTELLQ